MKLQLTQNHFKEIIGGELVPTNSIGTEALIDSVFYDSRKIGTTSNAAFFALTSSLGDGHRYLELAYQKGVRTFVVSEPVDFQKEDAIIYGVENTWNALFALAKYQRNLFKGTMILISGKIGKTTVKEWIYQLISPEIKVSRSPKSYNSELGIALSLLELKPNSEVALIEVKPHAELNPGAMNELIRPEIGVWTTAVGSQPESMPSEFINALFKNCHTFIHGAKTLSIAPLNKTKTISCFPLTKELVLPQFLNDEISQTNASIAYCAANQIVKDEQKLKARISQLTRLALRMETFDGQNNNFIINDAYSLDADSMRNALEFQQQIANGKKRVVLIGLEENNGALKTELQSIINQFAPETVVFIENSSDKLPEFTNSIILIKGLRKTGISRLANEFKANKHKTVIHIDLKSLRKNILAHKQLLPKGTKIMAMVKAAGYGLGLQKMAHFVESFGVDYLGVAYADEGVQIRNAGVSKPILVMNAEEETFQSCITNKLEPAIYDFQQLDTFISECIYQGVENYPIHLKIDTGMNRLGFIPSDVDKIIEIVDAQPEVRIRSVYSHLSDADNRRDKRFTELQISKFNEVVKKLSAHIPYRFETHILNSSGIANFPNASFSMVRIGIGMYGISSNPELKRKLEPVLSWYSVVSQLKTIEKGQSVGYNRAFIATASTSVATIPIGYADGFKRSLSNGKGYVIIQGKECPTLGKVCMDMIMVDVTQLDIKVGDEVEIIGPHLTLEKMAALQDTIPYEIMTSISSRVHRIYIE